MKTISILLLLVLLSIVTSLTYYTGNYKKSERANIYSNDTQEFCRNVNDSVSSTYTIESELFPADNKILVKENIQWRNTSDTIINKFQLVLGENDLLSNSDAYLNPAQKPASFVNIKFKNILIDGIKREPIYPEFDSINIGDSSVVYLDLYRNILPGDSLIISLDYELHIPEKGVNLGRASGRKFFCVSNWYPKIICNNKYGTTNNQINTDLSNKNFSENIFIKLTLPRGIELITNGIKLDSLINGERKSYHLFNNGAGDVAWIAASNIVKKRSSIETTDGSNIRFSTYLQPEKEHYYNRYLNAAKASIKYIESNLGKFPYKNISLVDIPRTSSSSRIVFGKVITTSSELISPFNLLQIEFEIAKLVSKQFLEFKLPHYINDEEWFIESLSSKLGSDIVEKEFGRARLNFTFASYYPVKGLNFLSYNEIPIVYSLTDLQYDIALADLRKYYANPTIGAISNKFYNYPDMNSYIANKSIKPYLLLKSISKTIGGSEFNKLLKNYLEQNKDINLHYEKFFRLIQSKAGNNITELVSRFYRDPVYLDYRIKNVKHFAPNEYEVFAERLGDAAGKATVSLITENGKINKVWNGTGRFKILKFHTKEKVIAAEIILNNAEYLDVNFADNSYTLEKKYWGSMSLAIRCFFWFQNAIMIFGSVG